MPAAYIPLLVFALLVVFFPALLLLAFKSLLSGSTGDHADPRPDGSEIEPVSSVRVVYSSRFYVVAMLVVILDAGTLFLFLWAISFRKWVVLHLGAFALVSMMVFFGILSVGYVWIYKKGALDWAE